MLKTGSMDRASDKTTLYAEFVGVDGADPADAMGEQLRSGLMGSRHGGMGAAGLDAPGLEGAQIIVVPMPQEPASRSAAEPEPALEVTKSIPQMAGMAIGGLAVLVVALGAYAVALRGTVADANAEAVTPVSKSALQVSHLGNRSR